jgi:hypothetical protein
MGDEPVPVAPAPVAAQPAPQPEPAPRVQPVQQQPSIKQWFMHNWKSMTLVATVAALGAWVFFRK